MQYGYVRKNLRTVNQMYNRGMHLTKVKNRKVFKIKMLHGAECLRAYFAFHVDF